MMRKRDNEVMRTDELIHRLSIQAGMKAHAAMPFGRTVWVSLTLSIAAALLVVIGVSGLRPDLSAVLTAWPFQFKAAAMTLLAGGGVILVYAAGTPGMVRSPLLALLPGVLFLLAGALFDLSGIPPLGVRQLSAPVCVGVIVAASLPGLIIILAGLRRGTPTRLAFAGATSGVLSGSLAALAYTVACVNDGALFVAIWYVVAITITTAIGAFTGRYALAW
jgi:hypothetical protein